MICEMRGLSYSNQVGSKRKKNDQNDEFEKGRSFKKQKNVEPKTEFNQFDAIVEITKYISNKNDLLSIFCLNKSINRSFRMALASVSKRFQISNDMAHKNTLSTQISLFNQVNQSSNLESQSRCHQLLKIGLSLKQISELEITKQKEFLDAFYCQEAKLALNAF